MNNMSQKIISSDSSSKNSLNVLTLLYIFNQINSQILFFLHKLGEHMLN
jgi:hypothetical protein